MSYWQKMEEVDNDFSFYYLTSDDKDAQQYQFDKDGTGKALNPLTSTRLKYLESLSFQTMEMDWDSSQDGNGNNYYGFDFGYDFSPRMHLTSVTKKAFNETPENPEKYTLEYNDLGMLPKDYLTTKADHWGYYNGKGYKIRNLFITENETGNNDNEEIEPPEEQAGVEEDWMENDEEDNNTNNGNIIGSNKLRLLRDPNPDFSHYGSLKKIFYPTGGWSEFEYEQNDFSYCVSLDRQNMRDSIGYAGGLRIKSISEYDHDSNLLKRRTFSYTDPQTGNSSGELFATPCYYWKNWTIPSSNYFDITYYNTCIRMSSIIPLSNSFGPHVGYSCVTEAAEDGSQTQYRYSNISAAMDERYIGHERTIPVSPYEKFSEKGFMRGKLLFQKCFDKDGNKVRSLGFKYRKDSNNYENRFVYGSDFSIFN